MRRLIKFVSRIPNIYFYASLFLKKTYFRSLSKKVYYIVTCQTHINYLKQQRVYFYIYKITIDSNNSIEYLHHYIFQFSQCEMSDINKVDNIGAKLSNFTQIQWFTFRTEIVSCDDFCIDDSNQNDFPIKLTSEQRFNFVLSLRSTTEFFALETHFNTNAIQMNERDFTFTLHQNKKKERKKNRRPNICTPL